MVLQTGADNMGMCSFTDFDFDVYKLAFDSFGYCVVWRLVTAGWNQNQTKLDCLVSVLHKKQVTG